MILTHGSLFSGIGGFDLASERKGIHNIWACEFDDFCKKVLSKNFPDIDINDNIKEFKNPKYVDIISGGFPCQDISIAGKGKGLDGERSGLWKEMFRIIEIVKPKYVIAENSPMLLKRGFETVVNDLSKIGYDIEWQVLSAKSFGIQQSRKRIYIIAHTKDIYGNQEVSKESIFSESILQEQFRGVSPRWRDRSSIPQPRCVGDLNAVPNGVDRVKTLGNAVIPTIAEYLFECIKSYEYKKKTES